MEEKNKEEKIKPEIKTKPINIFFCFDKIFNEFNDLKKLIDSMKNKFINRGKYNDFDLLNEISYFLGNKHETKGKIKIKQTQNIIILDISFNKAKELLFQFIKKFEKGIVKNDDHPFFIFLPFKNNANYTIKNFILEINEFQKHINDSRKLDTRNICFETKETILDKIESIYNYYTENDEVNIDFNQKSNYNKMFTINILMMGKRGSGKSTLINRLLGEKKAYAHKNAKTLFTKEYYHGHFPIKFIDSPGFEIGTLNQINNVTEFLNKNNINESNIFKKIHFIFYLFKKDDKFEDIEFEIIKKLFTFNVEIFFIFSHITIDDEDSCISDFEYNLTNKFFNDGEIDNIINNTFCLDFLDIKYSNKISEILSTINKKIEKYKESNNKIKEYIENFNILQGNCQTPVGDSIKALNIYSNNNEGILTKKSIDNPEEVLKLIKNEIKNNVFLFDIENDRVQKKNMALKIVKSYEDSSKWWRIIPVFDGILAYLSRKRMINEIKQIYETVVQKRLRENNQKEYYENILKIIFPGILSSIETKSVGEKIIIEFDKEYAKIQIIDKYYDNLKQLDICFNCLKEFPTLFKDKYWYDIKIHE